MLFVFSTPVLIRHLWQLQIVVFLQWCLICALQLLLSANREILFYSFCQSSCLSIFLSVCASSVCSSFWSVSHIRLFAYLSNSLSFSIILLRLLTVFCLHFCLYVHSSVCLTLHLTVFPSICLSVHPLSVFYDVIPLVPHPFVALLLVQASVHLSNRFSVLCSNRLSYRLSVLELVAVFSG
jgi:hypothetical protein